MFYYRDSLLYSPLEQFELISFFFSEEFCDISNMGVFLLLVLLCIVLYINMNQSHFLFYSSLLQMIMLLLYKLVLDMLVQQAGEKAIKYFTFMFVAFIIVIIANLLGMLPYGFTVTAHLSVTFFLALSYNLGFFLLGLDLHEWSFFKLFIPAGTPSLLLPLIVAIEVVSYLIRTFSLSIRLFANMMAGHCLLFVISSFVFNIVNAFTSVAVAPFAVIYFGVFVLEFFIAFLQAYVFVILLCIYLNDALHPSH